ncbi:hypothetical protein DAPPUDRAFT_122625 [Daphnia pulex]|uniref:Uncharacterized protein n=1 Tax=Daphnia pulex TaxID=6669 RepID=E9I4R2_DAPPU|nr:hypothetical protein DAPPUDRAFT_122625 [Daphnia pulex]|eukprot:EFX61019.1 hypothetical protein DAPPUDRAFT_122625 [Daphnia pulex]
MKMTFNFRVLLTKHYRKRFNEKKLLQVLLPNLFRLKCTLETLGFGGFWNFTTWSPDENHAGRQVRSVADVTEQRNGFVRRGYARNVVSLDVPVPQRISNVVFISLRYSAFHHVCFMPQPQQKAQPHYQQQQQQPIYYHYQQPTYRPDVVAIQVHRNSSSEDLRSCQPGPVANAEPAALQQTFYKLVWRQSSYEDGDVTPVSEHSHHLLPQGQNVPGGGTLPRPRGTVKPRPVAKISAKTRTD